jgi:hypothetical protein
MGEAARRRAAGQVPALYHYTSLQHLPHILADGCLQPARVQEGHHCGILWLTRQPHYEPASYRQGTAGAQMPVRFRVPPDYGRDWRRVSRAAGASDRWIVGIAEAGRKLGSDPAKWLATLDPIPVAGLTIDAPAGDAPVMRLQDALWVPVEGFSVEDTELDETALGEVLDEMERARKAPGVDPRNAAKMTGTPTITSRVLLLDGIPGLVSTQLRFPGGNCTYASTPAALVDTTAA